MKKNIIKRTMVCVLAATMLVGSMSGCSTKKQEKGKKEESKKDDSKTIITIGDEKYTLADLMYYVYSEEETGALYSQVYEQFYGTDYWETKIEENDNKTGEKVAKDNIINNVEQDTVLYNEALKAGYSLSDDDKKTAKDNYNDFVSNLTDEQLAVEGMKDELLTYFERQVIIDEYKESLLKESKFDADKVTASVSKKDCREYVYEYYSINKEDDDSGKAFSAKQMKERLADLKQVSKKITAKNDMESLLTAKQKKYIEYSDDYMVEEDGEGYGTYKKVNADAIVKGLKNGQVSDIVETEFAYYVFRMNDNNNTEYYDESVDNALNKARDKVYKTAFDAVKKDYNITVNDKVWDKVKIGSLIYLTDENEEDSSEDTSSDANTSENNSEENNDGFTIDVEE